MVIQFPFDEEKAEQTLIWLLEKQGGRIQKAKALSWVLLADRLHLKKWRRPVLGGCYLAIGSDPIHSEFSKLIDETQTKAQKDTGFVYKSFVGSRFQPDMGRFSDSDIMALSEVIREYGKLSLLELKVLIKGITDKNLKGGFAGDLPYEDLFKDILSEDLLELMLDEQEIRDWLHEPA